jgi:Ser/Thr protein kinase RdoA (MazF antagonist)
MTGFNKLSPDEPLTLADFRFEPPQFSPAQLADIASRFYGIEGEHKPLRGERDQNTRITLQDGKQFVLKVSGALEDHSVVDFQVRALQHIARQDPGLPVPRMIPGKDGALIQIFLNEQDVHQVRLLSYLPGIPYDDGPAPSLQGLTGIGMFLGRLCRALKDFSHPAGTHFMPWDICNGLIFQPQMLGLFTPGERQWIEPEVRRIQGDVYPQMGALRKQIIHQDGHGGNLLRVSAESEEVAGMIDFGDMIHGPLICDLAACAADFFQQGPDTLAIASAMCQGFNSVTGLEEKELELLPDLVMVRQILTLQMFRFRLANMPNPPAFLTEEQPSIFRSLKRLASLDRNAYLREVRRVCGT